MEDGGGTARLGPLEGVAAVALAVSLLCCPTRVGFEPLHRDGERPAGGEAAIGTDGASPGEGDRAPAGDVIFWGDEVGVGDGSSSGDERNDGDGVGAACSVRQGDPMRGLLVCPDGTWCDGDVCRRCDAPDRCGDRCVDCTAEVANWDCIEGSCGCNGAEDCSAWMFCSLPQHTCMPALDGDSGPPGGDGSCTGICSVSNSECAACGGGATVCNASLGCCALCSGCVCVF